MKWWLARLLARCDDALHRLGWTPAWLCTAADVAYGVGPEHQKKPLRFHWWLYRWLYPDKRVTVQLSHQATSGSYPNATELRCSRCGTLVSDWETTRCLTATGERVPHKGCEGS